MFFDKCMDVMKKRRTVFTNEEGEVHSFPEFQLFYINEDSSDFVNIKYQTEKIITFLKASKPPKFECFGYMPYMNTALEFDNGLYLFSSTVSEYNNFYLSDQCKWTDGMSEVHTISCFFIKKRGSSFLKALKKNGINGTVPWHKIECDGKNVVYCGLTVPMDDFSWEYKYSLFQQGVRTMIILSKFINFLSCKNIRIVDNKPPDKLNKKRLKRKKQPLVSYKTLEISPISKSNREHERRNLWNNRIHLCRGHFKEYTPEKPLFGKFTGRYWWQPSVRGRNTDGVVMKDYEVRT